MGDQEPHNDSHPQNGSMKNNSITVLVPVYNEEAVLAEFHSQLSSAMRAIERRYNVLYVNDGSSDESKACIVALQQT